MVIEHVPSAGHDADGIFILLRVGAGLPPKKVRGFKACGDEKTAMCWRA